jgi:hypothetical protein
MYIVLKIKELWFYQSQRSRLSIIVPKLSDILSGQKTGQT